MRILLSAPDVTEREIEAVAEVLRTPHLSMGPKLAGFEHDVAAYAGTRHAVAVNSGTSGLHLSVRAFGIKAGDEVITPFSFVASANALLYEGDVGGRSVFQHVEQLAPEGEAPPLARRVVYGVPLAHTQART
jgi:dTDP-4-amino-4,6-dideoxygalactose transaminase